MAEKRFYQRSTINGKDNESIPSDIKIDGILMRLVDFSLGGLCFLSEKSYAIGDILTISVNQENQGEIDLVGKVIRVTQAGSSWSIALDLSPSYRHNVWEEN